jgi:hypothetical protein
MKLLIFLLLSLPVFGKTNIEEAKKSIQTLIKPLLPGQEKVRPKGTEKFRVDACDKKKINWMEVLMMRAEATLDYKFKPGCDIEGTIRPKILSEFPAKLKLRNVESYNEVESTNRVTANLDSKPILNLEMRSGELNGKSKVKFEVDYQVQINPLDKSRPVEKNLGGELRITEIDGQKTSIKEKIMVE